MMNTTSYFTMQFLYYFFMAYGRMGEKLIYSMFSF